MKITLVLLAAVAAAFAQDTISPTGAECEPHGDHWHCPEGIPEPTTPPALSVTTSAVSGTPTSGERENGTTTPAPSAAPTSDDHDHEATATTCEPHGDHWHCPSGVAEPTTPPAVESSPTASSPEGTVTTAAPSQFTGAAVVGAKREGLGAMVLGAIGVFLI